MLSFKSCFVFYAGDYLISRSSKAMSLDVPPMDCTYLSLFVSLEDFLA